ncbi:hypothetical protein ACF052_02600 [Streptomyces pilosus]|uniref:hypothetical protein n=1 Tax=Streptomyces pilosus TaxID=28893 RepID=UPI0036FFFE48
MASEQLPDGMREFAGLLRALLARVDRHGGWCLVFRQRDPEGLRACAEGREPPPWDVVESLLHDLAAAHGPAAAEAEVPRTRALYAAALAAYDARPGAREALHGRLDVVLRERRHAAERRTGLARRLAAATAEEARALRTDLAWADDDHRRAAARCAEITARLRALDRHAARAEPLPPSPAPHESHFRAPAPDRTPAPDRAPDRTPAPDRAPDRTPAPDRAPAPDRTSAPDRAPAPGRAGAGSASAPAPKRPSAGARGRRRGGARFAGVEEEAGAVAVPPVAVPAVTASRGARFAGVAEGPGEGTEPGSGTPGGAADRQEVDRAVAELVRLRGAGRSGEAHALLTEAAASPAARLPLFADAMLSAGLGADWTTLLWEAAAALPADRLVAAADALTGAGRAVDGGQILRHGVVRPADEIGRAALTLDAQARHREALALLDACVRMRTPADAARTAAADPRRLVPLLLTVSRGVSETRHRDLLHALRVAGLAV